MKAAFLAPSSNLTRAASVECAEGGFSSRKSKLDRTAMSSIDRTDVLDMGSSGGSLPPTPNTRGSFVFDGKSEQIPHYRMI